MEPLGWIAVAGVAALVPPVRERIVPVSKALGKAGIGLAGAAFGGVKEIVLAAAHGEPPKPEEPAPPAARKRAPSRPRRAVKAA